MPKKITLTFTQTLDGRIATKTGESRYISEAASLKINQEMRRDYDAIAVGIGTVLKDDPLLTCRIEKDCNPVRVILDQFLHTPPNSQIARFAKDVKTIVFYNKAILAGNNSQSVQNRKVTLEKLHIATVGVEADADGRLILKRILQYLDDSSINTLMVEGGSSVITAFIREDLWTDMIVVSVAKIMGHGIPAIGNLGIGSLNDIIVPKVNKIEVIGNEVLWYLEKPLKQNQITTRTLYFTAPKTVEIRREILTFPADGKKLFRSVIMGISPGTERQIYLGNFIRDKAFDPVIDVKKGAFSFPFSYGYINVVEDAAGGRFFGFLHHSEQILADEDELFPLKDDFDDALALFFPHMETAVSIIHDSQPMLGDRILITGAGVVGTLTSRVLENMGMENIIYDIDSNKEAWFPHGNFYYDSVPEPKKFDLCIETSGSPQGLETCMECSRRDGRITVASWYGEKKISLNLGTDFHWKRLKLFSSQVSHMSPLMGMNWNKSRRLKFAAELTFKLNPLDLLTHRFPFSKSADAFRLLIENKEMYGLIALIPGS